MEIKQGVGHFIVKVDSRYNETLNAKGIDGKPLVSAHQFNDHHNVTKKGQILSTPKGLDIPLGAFLYFDFKICKKEKYGESYVINEKEGIYRVPYFTSGINNMAYAYQVGDKVIPLNEFLFVKPIKEEVKTTESGLVIAEGSGNLDKKFYLSGEVKNKENQGEVVYVGDYFKEWDIMVGDTVFYKKGAEYSFDINGQTLFRIPESFLLAKAV